MRASAARYSTELGRAKRGMAVLLIIGGITIFDAYQVNGTGTGTSMYQVYVMDVLVVALRSSIRLLCEMRRTCTQSGKQIRYDSIE